MLRVGYSTNLAPELLKDFPEGVELIALARDLDHDVDIEVWLPDPYPTRNTQIVPHLRANSGVATARAYNSGKCFAIATAPG